MASRFVGRDYATLREEIIEFLRQKLPSDWDYTNLSDPIVVFAESLARVGDQLHYTIDELRRECDVATAKRASSIYSYAMREGYKMYLPRAAFGHMSINSPLNAINKYVFYIDKFDELKLKSTGDTLYATEDIGPVNLYAPLDQDYVADLSKYIDENGKIVNNKRNIYAAYVADIESKTVHIDLVLGTKGEFTFTYNDINNDSTVTLPDANIDRNLVRLTYNTDSMGENVYSEIEYVDDVISSGFIQKSFTLTPKFIGGNLTLNIEFPTNYRDIFNRDKSTNFKFEYVITKDTSIPAGDISDDIDLSEHIIVSKSGEEDDPDPQWVAVLEDGIKGYSGYEDPNVTRDNYKKFVQNYAALLTKDDYTSYIQAFTSQYCQVFDHSDMYKYPAVLPEGTDLLTRTMYILTESLYDGRKALWEDLKERSGRSDCIVLFHYGKDPYTIVIKAECYLLGTSLESVATSIKSAILSYYNGPVGKRIPDTSMINYIAHKASDKVIRMENILLRDSTYGLIDTTFNNVNQLSAGDIDNLYEALKTGDIDYHISINRTTVADNGTSVGSTDNVYYLNGWHKISYSEDDPNNDGEDTIEPDERLVDFEGETVSDENQKKLKPFVTFKVNHLYDPAYVSSSSETFNDKLKKYKYVPWFKTDTQFFTINKTSISSNVWEDWVNDNKVPIVIELQRSSNGASGSWSPDGNTPIISITADNEYYEGYKFTFSDDNNNRNITLTIEDNDNNIKIISIDFSNYSSINLASFNSSKPLYLRYKKYELVEKYNKFPDEFPSIYLTTTDNERKIEDYDELVGHQIVYGELDNRGWDIADTDIFELTQSDIDDIESPYEGGYSDEDADKIKEYNEKKLKYKTINSEYIKHHYMSPTLCKVVVLIKAVSM